MKKPSGGLLIVGIVAITSLPLILFIDNPGIAKYLFQYLLISISLTLYIFYRFVYRGGGGLTKTTNIYDIYAISLFLISPFFLIAVYPFTFINLMVGMLVVIFGLLLPFVSSSLTLWFYTLGGLFPLPSQHKWLLKSKHNFEVSKKNYNNVIGNSLMGIVGVGYLISQIFRMRSDSISDFLVFMRLASLFIIFSLGLTIGVRLKKIQLNI